MAKSTVAIKAISFKFPVPAVDFELNGDVTTITVWSSPKAYLIVAHLEGRE